MLYNISIIVVISIIVLWFCGRSKSLLRGEKASCWLDTVYK